MRYKRQPLANSQPGIEALQQELNLGSNHMTLEDVLTVS